MARYTRVSSEQRRENSRFEELHPDEQHVLLKWILENFSPAVRETVNWGTGAYRLKHLFGNSEFGFYVFSREFAGAMAVAGFRCELDTERGDWYFNITQDDVEKAEKKSRTLGPVLFGIGNPAVG